MVQNMPLAPSAPDYKKKKNYLLQYFCMTVAKLINFPQNTS